jgi:hypothetical protein
MQGPPEISAWRNAQRQRRRKEGFTLCSMSREALIEVNLAYIEKCLCLRKA